MISGNTQFRCFRILQSQLDEAVAALVQTEAAGILSPSELCKLYESIYLRMFISFEGFIESCFLCYLMGKKTNAGYKPNIVIKPRTIEDCFNWIWGKKVQKRDYIDWSDLGFVRDKSILFWGQDDTPFNKLLSDSPRYKEMKKLRNAIVHLSQYHNDTLVDLEHKFHQSTSGRKAGEILKTTYKSTNKPLIYYLKKEFVKYAEITLLDPSI